MEAESRRAQEPLDDETSVGIFSYIYAILNSPAYRSRYRTSLQSEFPRIPIPLSSKLFRALSQLGADLVALHVLDSPRLINLPSTYSGAVSPMVGRVEWVGGTVWLDGAPRRTDARASGKPAFEGVPDAVWSLHVGGYQVCEKWLKDRKGRALSADDITHYQKIVVALTETIRLMKEIDEVIDVHGGWPTAFQPATPSVVITG